jgi:hypothetical protein
MKIAVVSTGRSRCTLVAFYLHTVYSELEFCREFYTESSWEYKLDLVSLTDELMDKENFIVKIMSLNLYEGYEPSVFKFEEYDELHLVERHDFFEQCCSWYTARMNKLYHLRNDSENSGEKEFGYIRKQKNKIKLEYIKEYAEYVDRYIKLKRYIIDNNLKFTMHTYESAKEFDKKQSVIEDSNLNYSDLITNYQLKDDINALFNECFSYDNLTSDLDSFNTRVGNIKGLNSLQSFAKQMNTRWNK